MMKSSRHYIARIGQMMFERRNPNAPWIVRHCLPALDTLLRPTDVGLEWGCGRSTAWFAERVDRITSIEDDKFWYDAVIRQIVERGVAERVRILLVDPDNYVSAARDLDLLDFCLVDGGRDRGKCMEAAFSKIKAGGFIILDNAHWYLPCQFSLPDKLSATEPREIWTTIEAELKNWRALWFHDHVSATAIFIKK